MSQPVYEGNRIVEENGTGRIASLDGSSSPNKETGNHEGTTAQQPVKGKLYEELVQETLAVNQRSSPYTIPLYGEEGGAHVPIMVDRAQIVYVQPRKSPYYDYFYGNRGYFTNGWWLTELISCSFTKH